MTFVSSNTFLLLFMIFSLKLLPMDVGQDNLILLLNFMKENGLETININELKEVICESKPNICEDISDDHPGLIYRDTTNYRTMFISPNSKNQKKVVYAMIASKEYARDELRFSYTERTDYQKAYSDCWHKIQTYDENGEEYYEAKIIHFWTLVDIEAKALKKYQSCNLSNKNNRCLYIGESDRTLLDRGGEHATDMGNYGHRYQRKVHSLHEAMKENYNVAIFPVVVNLSDNLYRKLCELILIELFWPDGNSRAPYSEVAELHEEYRNWKLENRIDNKWLINRANEINPHPVLPKRLNFDDLY